MRHAQTIWDDYRGPIIYELALWLESEAFATLLAEGCEIPPQLCDARMPPTPSSPPPLILTPTPTPTQEPAAPTPATVERSQPTHVPEAKAQPEEKGASHASSFWDVDEPNAASSQTPPQQQQHLRSKLPEPGVKSTEESTMSTVGFDKAQMAGVKSLDSPHHPSCLRRTAFPAFHPDGRAGVRAGGRAGIWVLSTVFC